MRKKPVERTQAWEKPVETSEQVEQGTDLIPGEYITKAGQHHVKNYIEKTRQQNIERREKYLRDLGGRDRDPRRIPPPSEQLGPQTWKSVSKIRTPSRAFRANYDSVFGPNAGPKRMRNIG